GVGVAVDLGLVVGLDGEGCRGDGEGGVDELDVVVGEAGAGAGCDVRGDRVAADAARCIGGRRVAVRQVVAVPGAGDGAGQGGVGVAVDLGLVVGLDGERRLGDGKGGVDELDVVVAEGGARAGSDVGVDRVAADAARRVGPSGVAVDEVVAV